MGAHQSMWLIIGTLLAAVATAVMGLVRIYEPHQDQITINEDQKSLTLKCTSNWTSIDWYKGNMELMTSDRISVSKFVGGNVAYISLLIPYITVKDSGTYTCKTNIDGMEEDSISVTVTPSVVKPKTIKISTTTTSPVSATDTSSWNGSPNVTSGLVVIHDVNVVKASRSSLNRTDILTMVSTLLVSYVLHQWRGSL